MKQRQTRKPRDGRPPYLVLNSIPRGVDWLSITAARMKRGKEVKKCRKKGIST
jgi:hypothetical protein